MADDTVHAVRIEAHGGIARLRVVDITTPRPGADQVLVRTVASSLNPVDWKTRAWDVGPALPATLGWDLAGIVIGGADGQAAGGGAEGGYAAGDRVVAMSAQIATGRGTWAETVALPARLLAPAPRSVPLATGIGVQEDGAMLAELCGLVDAGVLPLRIARRFPLSDVRAAHEAFEGGGLVGKVVLDL